MNSASTARLAVLMMFISTMVFAQNDQANSSAESEPAKYPTYYCDGINHLFQDALILDVGSDSIEVRTTEKGEKQYVLVRSQLLFPKIKTFDVGVFKQYSSSAVRSYLSIPNENIYLTVSNLDEKEPLRLIYTLYEAKSICIFKP